MFINLTIQEIGPVSSVGHHSAWHSIRDESGDLSFEEICGIYKQASSKERLYLQDFGKDENLIIYIHQGTLRVNLKKTGCSVALGSVNFQSMEILQSLLSVIYNNQQIAGICALDLLFKSKPNKGD